MSEEILQVENVKKYFRIGPNQTVKSVDDISFSIRKGETFGLVGESGSGKSTLGKMIVGLHAPTSGTIRFDGHELAGDLDRSTRKRLNREMQM
ncbi:ATP-binding cassette domain-containing protein, partial [Geobacillus sp. ZGt-1]